MLALEDGRRDGGLAIEKRERRDGGFGMEMMERRGGGFAMEKSERSMQQRFRPWSCSSAAEVHRAAPLGHGANRYTESDREGAVVGVSIPDGASTRD